MSMWDVMTVAAGVLGLVAAISFVARYLWESGVDAWRSPFGRFLLTRKILLSALFGTVIMNRLAGDWWQDYREPSAAIMITAFALQTFWPYRLLLKAQHEAQDPSQEAHRDNTQ